MLLIQTKSDELLCKNLNKKKKCTMVLEPPYQDFKICCDIHNMIHTANSKYDQENAAPIQQQDGLASLLWDWKKYEIEDM